MANKAEQVQLAKLAEQAERYPDMLLAMKKVVEMNSDLSGEERNLFSTAYKYVAGAHRSAWQTISSIAQDVQGSERQRTVAKTYQMKIDRELRNVCEELLTLLDKYLTPKATTTESKIFYLKMRGDYHRYLTEVTTGSERQKLAEAAERAYKEGFDIAKEHMIVTDPIRLGLALNFSVFYYEILHETDTACRLAKEAFDDALEGLSRLDGNAYREATLIMQPLLDNLNAWTGDKVDESGTSKPEEPN